MRNSLPPVVAVFDEVVAVIVVTVVSVVGAVVVVEINEVPVEDVTFEVPIVVSSEELAPEVGFTDTVKQNNEIS